MCIVFCLGSCLLPCWTLFGCYSSFVFWLLVLLFCLGVAYAIRLFLMHSNISSIGSYFCVHVLWLHIVCMCPLLLMLVWCVACCMLSFCHLWWVVLCMSDCCGCDLLSQQMVHGPPSSCWTITADHMGINANIGEASLSFLCCLSTNLLWCSSS